MRTKLWLLVLLALGATIVVGGCAPADESPPPKSASELNPSVGTPVGAGSAPDTGPSDMPNTPTVSGTKGAKPNGK